jgi:hypothetical protein
MGRVTIDLLNERQESTKRLHNLERSLEMNDPILDKA